MVKEVIIHFNGNRGNIIKPLYLSFLEVNNIYKLGIEYVEFMRIFIYENNLL